MANNFRRFGRRMRQIAENMEDHVEDVVRGAALVADQVVIQGTPVLSGRARSGWDVTVGTVSSSVPDSDPATPSAGESAALAQGQAAIGQWRIGQGTIYISNGLPYIRRLDEGYSAQAPAGMTADAALAAREYVREQRILRDV